MALTKFTDDVEVIQKLGDTPNSDNGLTAQALKVAFDTAGMLIKAYLNNTLTAQLDELLAENPEASEVTLSAISGMVATNVQAAIAELYNSIRDVSQSGVADGSITTAKLADLAVEEGKIADGAVTTDKIGESAVTSAKINSYAVTSSKLGSSSVTATKLATDAVITAKIKDKNVTAAKLADKAVSTAKLGDESVTTAKLGDSAVTTDKVIDSAITSAKIGSLEVKTANIDNLAVATGKIADGAVTTDKIAANAVSSTYSQTLLAESWSGTEAPFTQQVTVAGLLDTDNPVVDVTYSGTYSTDEERFKQFSKVYRVVTATNKATFYAIEKPTLNLPVRFLCVRK